MRPRKRGRELNDIGDQAPPHQGLWNGPEFTEVIQPCWRGRGAWGPSSPTMLSPWDPSSPTMLSPWGPSSPTTLSPWGPSSPTGARTAPGEAVGKDSERGRQARGEEGGYPGCAAHTL